MKKKLFVTFYSLFIFSNSFSQQWFPLGTGLIGSGQYDQVNTLCNDSSHNRLWASGVFQIAGSDSVHNVAWWDGMNWHPMQCFVSSNDTFNYGGDMKISSSIMFNNRFLFSVDKSVAFNRWRIFELNEDSISYRTIGSFNKDINAMCIYHDTLYVAGEFTNYQSVPTGTTINVNRIAKWNGTDFIPVGSGIGSGGIVNDLCVYNDKLIAAGYFEGAGGNYCKNIAAWDGTTWSAIGNGLGQASTFDVIIKSVCSYNGKLYAGGLFNNALISGVDTDLAFWDGSSWNPSDGGPFVYVTCIDSFFNKLFVGGGNCYSVSYPNSFVYYNDTSWFGTSDGPTQKTYSIVQYNDSLYIGGEFKLLYDHPGEYYGYVARFDPAIDTKIIEPLPVNSFQLSVSPLNENNISINILTTRIIAVELLIYNMQGQLVSSKNITLRAGENHFNEPTPYAQGMYLLQMRTKSEVRNVKFVKE